MLSADTNAILLLCATLGKRSADAPSPLSASEYDALAEALRAAGLRPGVLLHAAENEIEKIVERVQGKTKITSVRVAKLLAHGGQLAIALTKWTSAGIWICSRADSAYPSRYRRKLGRSSPPIVYGVGPIELLERGGLAVVGSRKPDPESETYATEVGHWAASAGVQIVSGAARGVDATAMLACADAGGTALGVVAEPLLRLSTRSEFRNAILQRRLCLISSFDPEAAFTVGNAMARNRWIYALADRGLVVACSEDRGGTWAGAIDAIQRGVDVYVKTGNPARPGNDALVRRGGIPAPHDLGEAFEQRVIKAAATDEATVFSSMRTVGDAYSLIVPALLALFDEPRTATQVAEELNIVKKQADVWLSRLVSDGKLVKQGSKFRRVQTIETQPTLFGG